MHTGPIGTLPRWDLVPMEYGYALDAVMPLLAGQGLPLVWCGVPALDAEVRQRLPILAEGKPARAALWVEPMLDSWQTDLDWLIAGMETKGILCVLASRPLARLLPERREWPGEPLGLQPSGLRRLRRALRDRGFAVEEYGIHGLGAIVRNLLAGLASRWGWPDLGDRLGFAARLSYITSGPLAPLPTVALLVARTAGPEGPAETGQVWSSPAAAKEERADPPADVDGAVARLDAWLETMRGPGGYGGPVAHWWRQGFLYTGSGLDWRYEGIIAGYLALWERTGEERWLDRARRAGDDLVEGQLDSGHFAASAFEMNPATGGTPGEAACDVGLLLLARALRARGDPAWESYAVTAEHNLRAFYLGKLWDPEARALRDGPGAPSFVPNKAATACDALFMLAELRADACWADQYALPTLDRILDYQVRDGGAMDGAIAQNSIGAKLVEKYFPFYMARCVPALLRGYQWSGEERYADAALAALRFIARRIYPDGSLPAVVYRGGRANRYPGWVAGLGDVLRAADLARPYGFDGNLSATRERMLAGQDASGGIQTATGFAAQAGSRMPDLPDLRDLLHVTGWSAMAFRYLTSGEALAESSVVAGTVIATAEPPVFEAACTFRGARMRLRETATDLLAFTEDRVRYHWHKSEPWPRLAKEEFWLR